MKEYFLWLAKFVTVLLLFVVIVPTLLIGVLSLGEKAQDLNVSSDKVVAVVELTGVITDAKEILDQLYEQANNDKTKGIVLRIDSPGGAVGPSQEIYSAVKSLKDKKPIVASMGALAASGGLYSALGASKILCQPGTLTGSIGVLMELPNFTKIMEKVGVEFITLKSGKLKDAGNTFRPMTEEDRQFLQATILAAHEDFVKAVSESRSIPLETVRTFADGRVILGSQARDLKLIDDYGDIYAAAREVFNLRGEPLAAEEYPKLVYAGDKFERIKKVLESASSLGTFFSRSVKLQYLMQ